MAAWRKLKMAGHDYEYKIGSQYAAIKYPDGKSKRASLDIVSGRPFDIIERGRWKKTDDGMVTPGMIRNYIELIGKE